MFSSDDLLQAPYKWHSVCFYPVLDFQHSRRNLFIESLVTALITSSRLSGPASVSSRVAFCLKISKAVHGSCGNNHKVSNSHHNVFPWTECDEIMEMVRFCGWWINYMWSFVFWFLWPQKFVLWFLGYTVILVIGGFIYLTWILCLHPASALILGAGCSFGMLLTTCKTKYCYNTDDQKLKSQVYMMSYFEM